MAATELPDHHDTRHQFDVALESVKRDAVLIAGLVLENARRASEAMLGNRFDLAEHVTEADAEIDHRSAELERHLFEVIARQQPVAGDLRFLISITRMVYELERTGNLVVNCVKSMLHNDGFVLSPKVRATLERLAMKTCEVFAHSIDSLDELDADLGARLESDDDEVDDIVAEFFTAISRDATEEGLETAIQLSRVGRYLERVADHGVNIGQHVHYIVTGAFPGGHHGAD